VRALRCAEGVPPMSERYALVLGRGYTVSLSNTTETITFCSAPVPPWQRGSQEVHLAHAD
jgi:hypothetical protein